MNDNLLIAAVLREVANAMFRASQEWSAETGRYQQAFNRHLLDRAAELDPPEKNEKPRLSGYDEL